MEDWDVRHVVNDSRDTIFFKRRSDAMKFVREIDRRLASIVMPKKK